MVSSFLSAALTLPFIIGSFVPSHYSTSLRRDGRGMEKAHSSLQHLDLLNTKDDRAISSGDPPAIAQIFPDISNPEIQFLFQAELLLNLGLTQDAIAVYEQELQRLHQAGDYTREALLLSGVAADFRLRGQLPTAVDYYQRALAIFEEHSAFWTEPDSYAYEASEVAHTLGAVHLALEQPEEALGVYERGLAMIARNAASSWMEPNLLSEMGRAYGIAGQTEAALATYQRAIALFQDMGGDAYVLPQVWYRIGWIHEEQGQFEAALAAYQQGLEGIDNPQDSGQVANRVLLLERIGYLYANQGQTEQAAVSRQQAEIALTTPPASGVSPAGDALRQATILEEIGKIYLADRQFDQAKSYFDRALAIARQSLNQPYDVTYLLNSITLHYTQAGQLERTIPYEEQKLAAIQETGLTVNTASTLASLAELYQRVGHWDRALATYQQALAAYENAQQEYGGQTLDMAQVMRQMGQVYEAQNQVELAIAAYQAALTQYQDDGFPYGQILVLEQLAHLYAEQGQNDQAQQHVQQAQALRSEIGLHPGQIQPQ